MKRCLSLLLALLLAMTACTAAPEETHPTTTATTPEEVASPDAPTQVPPTTQEPATEATQPPVEGILITEVMPDNKKLTLGHDRDWVELYNPNEFDGELSGLYLADDPASQDLLDLSGLTIPAQGYLVIELGEDAPFRLSSEGETVYLLAAGETVSSVTFGASDDGGSFHSDGVCPYVTPGYANTEEGYRSYLEAMPLPELAINEVLPSNSKYLATDGKAHDFVEVKNTSDHPIQLSAYTLSDKRSEPNRYQFPDVVLESGGCYVVYCSDEPALGANHAPFKISASGETVYLSKEGRITDVLTVPGDLGENESYGRVGKIPSYLAGVTPGKENSQGYLTGLAAPVASLPSGIYAEAVTVTLEAEGTIYYTTDGSRPTTGSSVYTQPLVLSGVTTVRTFCVSSDRTSSMTAYTYAVGAEHDLPVVCVAIPADSLNGEAGVLNNIDQSYEYEAMLTLIENGEEKFSVPFGFRLHGNDSRKMPKQNFQLRFRSEYGAGKLEYPLFEDRDIQQYDSLLLKGGSEDWYLTNLRDEICTDMADGTTNLYTQAIKPVVLYLGGSYWGIYFLRERFSDDYVADHMGVSPESVDLLYSTAGTVQKGSDKDFKALKEYVQSHDMSQTEHYQYLVDRIDALSLIDWYICRSYVCDADLANIRRFRSSEGDGKWRWMYFDLDWAMYRPEETSFTKLLNNRNGEPILIKALISSPEGQDLFLNRCAQLFDTVFTEENLLSVINNLAAQIQSEIPADRAKWGRSADKWESAMEEVRDFVSGGKRLEILKQDLKNYFHLTEEQMQSYFG